MCSTLVFSQNYKDEKVVKNITYIQNLKVEKESLSESSFKTSFVLAKDLLPSKLKTITILTLTRKDSKSGFSYIDTTYQKVKVLEHIQDNEQLCKNTLTIKIEKDVLLESRNSRSYLQWQIDLPLIHTIETDAEGNFKMESFTYKNTQFGMSKKVMDNGDVVELPFLNGQVHGCSKIISNGIEIIEKHYFLGEKCGLQTDKFSNGNLNSKIFFFNGLEEGYGETFYKDGGKLNDVTYNKGVINGAVVKYYRDGKICFKTTYKNGVKDGKYIKYYVSGALLGEANFVNGKLHGKYKDYYESGTVKSEGIYENDAQAEGWKTYDESGNEIK
jgi:antitoxin component YwqK of YwqJK toxin-antitoxin module